MKVYRFTGLLCMKIALAGVVIIFIPLRSRQHFVPFQDLNMCLLADMCNHTWIPECGFYARKIHTRLFIDECDMFEYNCDNNVLYKVTNYSECFGPATCPSVPNLLTRVQGFYIYYADGRRRLYNPKRSGTNHMHGTTETLTESTRSTLWKDRWRYTPQKTGHYTWTDDTTTECAPCLRMKTTKPAVHHETLSQYWPPIPPEMKKFFPLTAKPTTKRTTRRTTKRTTKRKKATTQILRTGTIGMVILKKVTVWKNGKKLVKVIKGYQPISTKHVNKEDDSDFLE